MCLIFIIKLISNVNFKALLHFFIVMPKPAEHASFSLCVYLSLPKVGTVWSGQKSTDYGKSGKSEWSRKKNPTKREKGQLSEHSIEGNKSVLYLVSTGNPH